MKCFKRKLLMFLFVFIVSVLSTGCNISDTLAKSLDKDNTIFSEQNTSLEENSLEYTKETWEVPISVTENDIDVSDIPAYNGLPYIELNRNVPDFTETQLVATSYEKYSALDGLGRCGIAVANIGQDLMPTEERGSIGMIKPTGWHTVKYDFVDGKYLYNRCHLIGYQLSGENDNERNLITGTRYMNVEGMLPFENMVADYVINTGNHVLYRVTPVYGGKDLLAKGIQIEAMSVEDGGKGIMFNVFCYNVQPGVEIDYATGESKLMDAEKTAIVGVSSETNTVITYVGNKNTEKFHYPSCSSVSDMKEKNRKYFYGDRSEVISLGYDPCGRCNP